MWSFRMVSSSKCTIVTDLMNNLSGFELFCRSYDSLMDSSKMKSNKVLEVLDILLDKHTGIIIDADNILLDKND